MQNRKLYLNLQRSKTFAGLNETGMKKALVYILSAVLLTAFSASCSTGLEPVGDLENTGYTIVISGTAADITTTEPLENVKITFYAAEVTEYGEGALVDRTVYTDNRGRFELTEGGFQQKILCRITAEDQTGTYESSTQEMIVSWSGPSFNSETGSFYANDVNFYLKKEE